MLSSDVNSAFRVMEENRFSLKLASEVCERQHGRVHERLTRGRETHIGYSYPFCLCVCLCVNDGKIKELFIAVETLAVIVRPSIEDPLSPLNCASLCVWGTCGSFSDD